MSRNIPIGGAAQQSGVKVPTIRYYEQIGLLPAPPQTESNRRLYDDDDLSRLASYGMRASWGLELNPFARSSSSRTTRTSHAQPPMRSHVLVLKRSSNG